MTIRLNKVTRDLNVGITTVVEFLQKKGYAIEANPNTKITDEQYDLLVKEFSTDKDLKLKTERFIQERQSKERNKASVAIDGYDKEAQEKPKTEEVVKAVVPEDVRPKFKPVGKIDLDKLNRKHTVEKEEEAVEPEMPVVEEVKAEEPAPVVEAPKPEPVPEPQPEPTPAPVVEPAPAAEEEKTAPVVVEPVPVSNAEPAPAATEEAVSENKEEKEEIFKIHQPEFVSKINVIGQIDLAALNQSTRPKKKSKEEKRKEREEKEKQRQDQKKLMKEAIIKEIRRDDNKTKDGNDANGKKKRVRINKEKVDINNASNFQRGGNDRLKGGQQGGNNQPAGKNKNKDRFKKPVIKQEVSEEDVAKQVKETLARLTSKGKNKGAKYRKEKRDMASSRMQELEDQEMAESKILKLTEFVTANELASMMDISVTQVIATCMSIGMMVSINQRLDAETINLVAEEFGFKTEYVSAEAARRSPIRKLVVDWKLALPLHPEFRTLPMVWYVPPTSPLVSGGVEDAEGLDRMRIPVRYLANLLAAGDEEPVRSALSRLLAMRRHMRDGQFQSTASAPFPSLRAHPDTSGVLADAGLTPEQAAEMYHLLAIARYEDRFVVPTSGRENHDDVWAMKGSEGLAQGEMEERA